MSSSGSSSSPIGTGSNTTTTAFSSNDFYSYFEDDEPWEGYIVHTNETGLGYYIFVCIYTLLALLLIIPLVSWNQNRSSQKQQVEQEHEEQEHEEQQQQQEQEQNPNNNEQPQQQQQDNSKIKNRHQLQYSSSQEEEEQQQEQQKTTNNNIQSSSLSRLRQQQHQHHRRRASTASSVSSNGGGGGGTNSIVGSSVVALRSVLLRELDQTYPDNDPDFHFSHTKNINQTIMKLSLSSSGEHPERKNDAVVDGCDEEGGGGVISKQRPYHKEEPNHEKHHNHHHHQQHQGDDSKAPTEASSGGIPPSPPPSVATTSKIHVRKSNKKLQQQEFYNRLLLPNNVNPSNKRFSQLVLDVSGRRWKTRRPIGRVDVISNAVASEISSLGGGSVTAAAATAAAIIRSNHSNSTINNKKGGGGGGSLTASNIRKRMNSTGSNSISRGGAGGPFPSNLQQSQNLHHQRQRMLSDVASSILSEQDHQLNQQPEVEVDISLMKKHHQLQQQAQLQQLQLLQQQNRQQNPFVAHRLAALQRQRQQQLRYNYHPSHRSIGKRGSRSIASERSAMSSIVDDISPNDAADANDPGQGNVFIDPDDKYLRNDQQQAGPYPVPTFGIHAGCCTGILERLLALSVPDEDKRRVLYTSLPLTLGAISESLFRLITTAFISQYLGTESMVAFLLVGLFVRLTSEELAGAIIDALSSFVQASIFSGPPPGTDSGKTAMEACAFLAGQYVQLAVILQLALNIPLLLVWVICMEDVVMWFVQSTTIAAIAQDYAFIVVFAYLVQAVSRTLTVVFHICGHEHFESIIDLAAATLQLATIACVVALVDNVSLTTVGYIQVLITVASSIAKITFPILRGWMQPFRKGLIQNVALVRNKVGIWHLSKAAGPLLLGTILEYGEWELLTIFVRHLGTAEVATWVLLGAFWDVLEAFTEGIGEAAANQVAFLLSIGLPRRASNLSNGSIYMAVIQALLITSALYMSGQYLSVLFSSDPTIQHLMNNAIVMIGFANVIMSFAQITWSLVGAQGRFRLATSIIFFSRWLITMPVALIGIYAFYLDLNAVSGSLVVGYATATCAMSFVVLSSDWDRLSRTMQEMNQPTFDDFDGKENGVDPNEIDPVLGLVNLDDFDDSDDSEGIGF